MIIPGVGAAVRGDVRGASAPNEISQRVWRTPPQSDYLSFKAPISREIHFSELREIVVE